MEFVTIYKNWVYRKPSANMSHFIGVDDIQVISFLVRLQCIPTNNDYTLRINSLLPFQKKISLLEEVNRVIANARRMRQMKQTLSIMTFETKHG